MIRHATVDDLKQIYLWTEAYYREYRVRKDYPISFDWKKTASYLWNRITDENGVTLLTDHGMLLGEIRESWFGPDKFAVMLVLYVEPSYRNGLLARSLLRRWHQIAENSGALAVLWDDWAGMTDSDMLTEYLEKLGYEVQGHVYRKDLKENHHAVHCTVHSSDSGGCRTTTI